MNNHSLIPFTQEPFSPSSPGPTIRIPHRSAVLTVSEAAYNRLCWDYKDALHQIRVLQFLLLGVVAGSIAIIAILVRLIR